MKLVLASTSPYRSRILEQLGIPFVTDNPGVDETAMPGETMPEYVTRLALEKARAVASRHEDSLIIGSDQACSIGGIIMGKPGTEEAGVKQLKMCSGNWLEFRTGLALINTRSRAENSVAEPFRVKFRQLVEQEIRAYIKRDRPLDCAGCFKVEAAGITLFDALEGRDYNTLLGLPMIALVDMLRSEGINPLLWQEC